MESQAALVDSPIRVLHVDDDENFASLAVDSLEQNDPRFEVMAATSGQATLDHLSKSDIDCVVTDFDMPEMGGLELLESIRKRSSELPLILLTCKGSEEVANRAISAAVTD